MGKMRRELELWVLSARRAMGRGDSWKISLLSSATNSEGISSRMGWGRCRFHKWKIVSMG
jgi:hypothetical protein